MSASRAGLALFVGMALLASTSAPRAEGVPLASVKVDAYPGRTFEAVVDSLAPGTDQTFSIMPAENATGNWVKVVQRIPVRLTLINTPPGYLIGAGMSATVKVDTQSSADNA